MECAVTHCIDNGILADFLSRNRAEAIAMNIFEYNEEKHMQRALSNPEYREQLYRENNL